LGKTILIENMGEKVDIELAGLLRKEVTVFNNQRMIKFCRKQYKYDKNINIFMVTNLSKPHYDINITNFVTLINFFVTVEGLE